jgi:hypothetical protein
VATWEGRYEDARAAVAEGVALLAQVDDPDVVIELCLAGRAARREARPAREERARTATGLWERAHAAATADGVAVGAAVRAKLLSVEAQWSRAVGRNDPDRWARAVRAWDELGCPWPAGHARWRQAEALLDHGASRDQARRSCGRHGRRPAGSGRGCFSPRRRRLSRGPGSGSSQRPRPSPAPPPRSSRYRRTDGSA